MLQSELISFFERDLLQLIKEIEMYSSDQKVWEVAPGISNSGGTLCLHLVGNLRHFIGTQIGHTGYVRERELEFSLRHIPRQQLIADIMDTLDTVKKSIASLSDDQLSALFPLEKHGRHVTHVHMLMHLLCHLGYHLGQVNYHRRMIDAPIIT